jgi:predicted PurR-regulated permease PerM
MSNPGTVGIIAGTAASAAVGIAASFVIVPAAAFLIFGTMFLQTFGTSLSLQSEIDSEIQRQKGICDQLKISQTQLDQLNSYIRDIQNISETDIQQNLSSINNSINAGTVQLESMKKRFRTKALVQIIIYIIVVAVLSFIIISKKSTTTGSL